MTTGIGYMFLILALGYAYVAIRCLQCNDLQASKHYHILSFLSVIAGLVAFK